MDQPRKAWKASLHWLDRFFEARSRNAILLFSLATSLAIGATDYHSSTSLLILYLAPISLAAWYGGSNVGSVISIYCTIAWFVAGEISDRFQSITATDVWSTAARLAIFLILTRLISRLRESSRQQHELTQFIVHDLRSPISSAITGLMTLQQTASNLDEVEMEMVSLALVSNQRALTLVNSMLDIAKLETGKMTINLEPALISELVEDAFQQVALWAAGQEVQLVANVDVPNEVLDVDLTVRVLVNLLSNALKFSPQGGEVSVTVQTAFGGGLRFIVEDHGPGIPPEYVQAIFEPFAQVKGTKGGSGLGLTFCRLAVQAQEGRIWAESTLGKGTKMIFTLPSRDASPRHRVTRDTESEEDQDELAPKLPLPNQWKGQSTEGAAKHPQ